MWYSKAHYERLRNGPPDTKETIAWRKAANEASPLAVADREAAFPELTTENGIEAMKYQEERIKFHINRILRGAQ